MSNATSNVSLSTSCPSDISNSSNPQKRHWKCQKIDNLLVWLILIFQKFTKLSYYQFGYHIRKSVGRLREQYTVVSSSIKSGILNPAGKGLYLLMRQLDHYQTFTRPWSWPDPGKKLVVIIKSYNPLSAGLSVPSKHQWQN